MLYKHIGVFLAPHVPYKDLLLDIVTAELFKQNSQGNEPVKNTHIWVECWLRH